MAKTAVAPKAAAADTDLAEIGRRYLDFLRVEREHKRITAQDASRTISFRSEETLALRRAEARAREIPKQILEAEERTQDTTEATSDLAGQRSRAAQVDCL